MAAALRSSLSARNERTTFPVRSIHASEYCANSPQRGSSGKETRHSRLYASSLADGRLYCRRNLRVAAVQQLIDFAQGIFATAFGSKSVAGGSKLALKDRFNNHTNGALHYAVAHRGNAQGSLFRAARLLNIDPFNRRRKCQRRQQWMSSVGKGCVRAALNPGRCKSGAFHAETDALSLG